MLKTKTFVALALAATTAYGVHRWTSSPSAEPADGGRLLLDRVWIDHMPRGERDTAQVFVVLTKERVGQEVGIFEARSMWRGQFEAFRYKLNGKKITATFPHTGDVEEYTAEASRCSKNGMDFCLEVAGGTHGVHQYYSRKGWEIEAGQTTAQIEARVAQIEADATEAE